MVVGIGSMENTITVLLLSLQGREADRNCCNGLVVLEISFSIHLFDSRCSYLLGFLFLSYFFFLSLADEHGFEMDSSQCNIKANP